MTGMAGLDRGRGPGLDRGYGPQYGADAGADRWIAGGALVAGAQGGAARARARGDVRIAARRARDGRETGLADAGCERADSEQARSEQADCGYADRESTHAA
ncbi:hypothetical protein [Lysobacter enzymogenes]|uniref:hypothetical protein n=1 Tax=Lysobacter enzymogenes TaxID=69 RepID=UPI0019D0B033|nr:hypothetical protein [Lysobacter enzymogenes]